MSVDLKKEFLNLLERDVEFRYMVAGYLGFSEIIKKIDGIYVELKNLREEQNKLWREIKELREEQRKLWENQNKLWENQNRMWEEIKALREGQNRLWENQNKLWEEVKSLREGQNKIWEEIRNLKEEQNKLWEEVKALREGQNKLWEEVRALRLGQERLWDEVRSIKVTLDRLVVSEEEEAWEVVGYRLRELEINVKLNRVFIDDAEINIYGASDDTCVFGETVVRLGSSLIYELEEKIRLAREKKHTLLRPKLIKVIYALVVTPQAIELAREHGIWVLSVRQEYTPLIIHSL
jgi:predicted  nucleic acid-binding Zn-ribbon protein